MKSIKEIADIIGVSKMTVYRYIKTSNITETQQDGRTLLYDDTTSNAIIKALSPKDDVTNDDTQEITNLKDDFIKMLEDTNAFLQDELDEKNKQLKRKDEQINDLQLILNQQQQLLLYEQQKNIKLIEDSTPKKSWWQKLFN